MSRKTDPLQVYLETIEAPANVIDQFWDAWESNPASLRNYYSQRIARSKASLLGAIVDLYDKAGGRFVNVHYQNYRIKMSMPYTAGGHKHYPLSKREGQVLNDCFRFIDAKIENHDPLFEYLDLCNRWKLNLEIYRSPKLASEYVLALDLDELFPYYWAERSAKEYSYQTGTVSNGPEEKVRRGKQSARRGNADRQGQQSARREGAATVRGSTARPSKQPILVGKKSS